MNCIDHGMRSILSITVVLVMAISGIGFFTTPVNAEVHNEVTFEMLTENDIILSTRNNQTGNSAMDTRLEIDSDYGNENGIVEPAEVEGYRNYLNDQVKGLSITQNTYLDRKALRITSTSVQVTGAEKAVNSSLPLQVIYTSELETLEDPGDVQWHTLVFLGEYYGNNTITVVAPAGWKIAKSHKNLLNAELNEDNNEITGIAAGNFDVEIKMYDPSKLGDGGQGTGEESALSTTDILLISFPLAIVVILIIFFIANRKKARKEKKESDPEDESGSPEAQEKDEVRKN